MRLLVSGCTETVRAVLAERPDRIGVLLTPGNGNSEWWNNQMPWACDNDCYKGLNAPAYLRMLARVLTFRSRPLWIACPDAVGNMAETWRRYSRWMPILRELGLPVALVLQDGLETFRNQGPWTHAIRGEGIAAVFVGGSTAWKLSDHAARFTLAAHDAGLLVHWGRVNTMRRIAYIARGMRDGRLWCDTIDGSGFSRFGEQKIPRAIRWIDQALGCKQQVIFGGTC